MRKVFKLILKVATFFLILFLIHAGIRHEQTFPSIILGGFALLTYFYYNYEELF